jgi:exopolysaccharide production protein ExoQ
MNKYMEIAERLFVIVSIIFYTGGPLPVILNGGMGEGLIDLTPDPTDYSGLQRLFFIHYGISFFLLAIRWKKSIYISTKEWTIWGLLALAITSIIWSSSPQVTSIRVVALVGNSLFGLYLASHYSIQEQLKLLGWSFSLIIVMSFLFAILMPFYGTMYAGVHMGSWRGIYVHKNVMGKVIGLGGLVFLALAINIKEKSWRYWFGLGFAFCLLILSRSSSSMINFLITIAVTPIYMTLRWSYYLMVPTVIATFTLLGGLSMWLNQNSTILLGSIGKDPTLTGRTNLWPQVLEMIWAKPWLGYGYNGFWNGWDSPGATVWYAVNWAAPNAHSGFLDLWLDAGLLGIIIFSIGFWNTLIHELNWIRTDKGWLSLWTLLYLVYFVLGNLTESSLFIRNDIFFLLYITISFSLAMNSSEINKILTENQA